MAHAAVTPVVQIQERQTQTPFDIRPRKTDLEGELPSITMETQQLAQRALLDSDVFQ